MIYTPLLLANQEKGFRIVDLVDNRSGGYKSTVWHVALKDTFEQVDESEVVMILEDGKWLNIEDAESLDIKKLRWKAYRIIGNENSYLGTITNELTHRYYGPLLAELTEKELITPNAELLVALKKAGYLPSNEESDETTPLAVPEESAHENETALPPPSHPASRVWLWWFALPAVAGAWLMWFVIRLQRRK